jgi:DNA-binding NarL/FixJ family response regulator
MKKLIRVMIVDDQKRLCESLAKLIAFEPDLEVVGVAYSGEEAVALAERLQAQHCLPDVVLMDVRMPRMNGIAATAIFHQRWPGSRVMILTTFDDVELIQAGLQAGALGYLLKDMSAEQLASTIRTAAQGQVLLHPEVASKIVALLPPFASAQPSLPQAVPPSAVLTNNSLQHLTEREREVLLLVTRGASNREISEALFLASGTVKNYLSTILSKLGVRDRTQAALKARELGVLQDNGYI